MNRFTGLYPISKTLRFELKPIGKTLENIEKKGILLRDFERAQSYKEVKIIIDKYHKDFIENSLNSFQFNPDFLTAFSIAYDSQDKARLQKVMESMRKQIADQFKNAPRFKRLFAKELIREDLPSFLGDSSSSNIISQFDRFTTYFTGFHENRKNIYSEEEQSTAIPYRIVNENLIKFAANAKAFGKIASSEVSNSFDSITKAFSDIIGNWRLEDFFIIDNYSVFTTQWGIDCYNAIIGGRVLEDGTKVQGVNEYVNLYNQSHSDKSDKLPKLNQLYKLMLFDRDSLSWLPAEFETDQQLLSTVEEYYRELMGCLQEGDNSLAEVLQSIDTYDVNHIYIKNDAQLTKLSQIVYGDWGLIHKYLGEYYCHIEPPKAKESEEKFEARKRAFVERQGSFSIGFLDSICELVENHGLANYYSSIGAAEDNELDLISVLVNAHSEASDLLNSDYPETKQLAQDKDNVAKVKNLMDSIKNIQHFLKPLLGTGTEPDKDSRFYGDIGETIEILDKATPLYNMVRNRMTKKPFSTEKVKLNFDNATLLNGWDQNKETDNCGMILRDKGLYYLLILEAQSASNFKNGMQSISGPHYEKMDYKLLPGANKMLPKVFFSKSRINEFAPSEEIIKHYKSGTHKKGPDFNLKHCHELIDFYKASIEKHKDWRNFGFLFSDTESYKDLSGFYREVEQQGYKLSFSKLSKDYVDQYVENGQAYLFQIYNKDFSAFSKGTPNLHTIYWRMLFDERNLSDVVYKLNGEAEIFFRKKSLEVVRPTHPAGEPIKNKNPKNERKESSFEYDLIKDRRYAVDKFQFHVPITMNFKAEGTGNININVREYIKEGGIKHIIGIDRGERNLLYISIINLEGEIVKQYSLNEIINEYKGQTYNVDYSRILEERAERRAEARKSWQTIETIKELKEGYISQAVHKVAELIVRYDAIVILEDLNIGFKRGRQRIESQVYQKFERMLIDKLNYLVDKHIDPAEGGGALKAYQLTNKFESFKRLDKQCGFLFYIPAWNTSKMDPATGFVNLFETRYENVERAKQFFSKFLDIRYNKEKAYYEFLFDYKDFTSKAEGTKTNWILCSYGDRVETMRSPENNNQFVSKEIDITKEIRNLFSEYNINEDNIKKSICNISSKSFFERLMHLFRLIVQMRNSITGTEVDYLLSPVAGPNGKFFDSRVSDGSLPIDADANGAFNIARKGLWIVDKIQNAEDLANVNLAISNREWLLFAQGLIR